MAHRYQVCMFLQTSWQGYLAWEDTCCSPVIISIELQGQGTLFLSLQLTLPCHLCDVAHPGGSLLLWFCVLSIRKVHLLLGVTFKPPLGDVRYCHRLVNGKWFCKWTCHSASFANRKCFAYFICWRWMVSFRCLFAPLVCSGREDPPSPAYGIPVSSSVCNKREKKGPSTAGRWSERCLLKFPPKGYRSWAPLQSPATLQGRRFLFCLTAAWEEAGCDRSFSVPSLLWGTRGNLEQQMLEKPDHFHFCRAEAKTCSLDEKNDLSRGCALTTHGWSTSLFPHLAKSWSYSDWTRSSFLLLLALQCHGKGTLWSPATSHPVQTGGAKAGSQQPPACAAGWDAGTAAGPDGTCAARCSALSRTGAKRCCEHRTASCHRILSSAGLESILSGRKNFMLSFDLCYPVRLALLYRAPAFLS